MSSLSDAYSKVLSKNKIISENTLQEVTDKLANAAKAIHGGIAPSSPQQQNNEESSGHKQKMIAIADNLIQLAQEIKKEYSINEP